MFLFAMFVGALSIISLTAHVLLTLQNWEFRRFVRRRLSEPFPATQLNCERVAIIVPVKGDDLGMHANLLALFRQDYPHYQLVFVVESEEDPALPIVRKLIAVNPSVPARMVVAGIASQCGQKVHNLLAATADLPKQVGILAFVDADARPPKHWLKTLVSRLHVSGNGAATGYRWFVPQRPTLANWFLYGINSSAGDLLGRHRFNLIWGGSWAIRRTVFEAVGLRQAWKGTLSDDLVAAQVVRHAGYRVEFEPACIVESPIDVSFGQLCEFVRRQLIIARHYTPLYWLMALMFNSAALAGFWLNVILTFVLVASGQSWWLPAAAAVVFYAVSVVRSLLRQDAVGELFPSHQRQLVSAQRFDIWAAPLVAGASWLLLLSSSFGTTVRWRGIKYIARGRQVINVCRSEDSTSLQKPGSESIRRAA